MNRQHAPAVTTSFTLFDTPIGHCGIAWSQRGVLAVQLPEARTRDTVARMQHEFPGAQETAPPVKVQRAISHIVALLQGKTCDLNAIALDMERLTPFHRRVYELARTIPPGATLTYGEVATRLGAPGSARAELGR